MTLPDDPSLVAATPASSIAPDTTSVPTDEDAIPERPLYDGDDGQGPPSNPDEDEEDTGGETEDGKGDGPPVPPQPK